MNIYKKTLALITISAFLMPARPVYPAYLAPVSTVETELAETFFRPRSSQQHDDDAFFHMFADTKKKANGRKEKLKKPNERRSRNEKKIVGNWIVNSLVYMKGLTESDDPAFPAFKETLNRIFKNLVVAANVKDPGSFKVLIVDIEEENMYVNIDARTVIVTRGLIYEMQQYEKKTKEPITEDLIAAILAHEIQHYILHEHKPQRFMLREQPEKGMYPDKFEKGEGEGIKGFFRSSAFVHLLHYREEYLADARSLRLMDRAGYNVSEAVSAIRFMKYLQEREWNARLDTIPKEARFLDEEILFLEDMRKEKLRESLFPSIFDTHPRTQDRLNQLYFLTINRRYRNENKQPVPVTLLVFTSPVGERARFRMDMMKDPKRSKITPFENQAQTVSQAEDLVFMYFLMELVGESSVNWDEAFDNAGRFMSFYSGIAYHYFAARYLMSTNPAIQWYFKHAESDWVETIVRDESWFTFGESGDDSPFEEGEDEEDEDANENDRSFIYRKTERMRKETIKAILKFLDQALYETNEFMSFEAERSRDYFRRLFTPWGAWDDEQARKALATDEFLQMPFAQQRFSSVLARCEQLFDKEHPGVRGVRRDMLVWLLFHSYYPNPGGYRLMQQIEEKIKKPQDLLYAVRHAPAKQYDDFLLKFAFTGYTGYAYLELLADYFIPRIF